MIYSVYIEKGEDFGFVAHCPSIPGCHSQGNSIEEAIDNIRDAIRGCLDVLGEEAYGPRLDFIKVDVEV